MSDRAPASGKRHLWDDPANVRWLIRCVVAACAVVALLDLVVRRHSPFEHGELAIEGTLFFYAWFGFVSCVALVIAAKGLRRLVMRDERYYRPGEGGPGQLEASDDR